MSNGEGEHPNLKFPLPIQGVLGVPWTQCIPTMTNPKLGLGNLYMHICMNYACSNPF